MSRAQEPTILFEILLNRLKSDCIYHAPIDLEQQTDVRLLFQINRKMVNTI